MTLAKRAFFFFDQTEYSRLPAVFVVGTENFVSYQEEKDGLHSAGFNPIRISFGWHSAHTLPRPCDKYRGNLCDGLRAAIRDTRKKIVAVLALGPRGNVCWKTLLHTGCWTETFTDKVSCLCTNEVARRFLYRYECPDLLVGCLRF